MDFKKLTSNQEFVEWISERKGLMIESQNEDVIKKLWDEYKREQEYDMILGY
ncbi:MAG: hypothetical protein ACRC6T_06745 [Sarcina sp.]